ncbi:MAG: hypothetical protein V1646_01700 [bacterium]
MLFKAGADPKMKIPYGDTDFHEAKRCGYNEVANMLIKAGAINQI